MLQPLSDNVRKVIDQAQVEARALNQEFVGTEHLLLALLRTKGTQALRILKQQHVDSDALRSALLTYMPFSDEAPVVTGQLPMSPKAQRVINAALVMAQSLREPKLSSRVLLLALMDEPGTPFLKALRSSGVDVDGILRVLAEKPAEAEA